MAHRAASEVAEMESENFLLRSDNEALRQALGISESQRDGFEVEIALLRARVQEELIRATQMETIMSQVSMGLVAGLKKMQDERQRASDIERALRTGKQGEYAGADKLVERAAAKPAPIDSRPAPRDLDEPDNYAPPYARSTRASLAEEARGFDATRDAAEAIAPLRAPAFLRPGQGPRADIHDPRMPRVRLAGADDDADQLRDLASTIRSG